MINLLKINIFLLTVLLPNISICQIQNMADTIYRNNINLIGYNYNNRLTIGIKTGIVFPTKINPELYIGKTVKIKQFTFTPLLFTSYFYYNTITINQNFINNGISVLINYNRKNIFSGIENRLIINTYCDIKSKTTINEYETGWFKYKPLYYISPYIGLTLKNRFDIYLIYTINKYSLTLYNAFPIGINYRF